MVGEPHFRYIFPDITKLAHTCYIISCPVEGREKPEAKEAQG
jgi:hypothetical protein